MDKRIEANKRVRQQIVDALLYLMAQKKFSEITITDIVNTAGVARQSYYRNFSSKESIIEEFFATIRSDIIKSNETIKQITPEYIVKILQVLKNHRSQILAIYDSGSSKIIQESINQYVEIVFGNMPSNSINRYHLYIWAGGVSNTAIVWLKNGAKESCEEMAKIIYDFRAADFLSQQPYFLE